MGLELYSLRSLAGKDLPGTLKLAHELGFAELETGALYGRTAEQFQKLAAANGLKVTATMADWNSLTKSTGEAARIAHTFGARYVVCSTIPHRKLLKAEDVDRAAENFNRWGAALAGEGLTLCYHTHGSEFSPGPDGTQFDSLMKKTDPKHVAYEMDVMWIVFGNQDPVALLKKYTGRFPLMHVKDMRKGEPHTGDPGPVREEASVPLGTGELDFVSIFRAAASHGVKHYYIEEEHPNAVAQIRQSLEYLRNLKV
ncbi:MAG: sugar phosphate isomerase/epimerase [Acidobacteria bacterium]|nr:sugar phosphate isomerase/epimerase [Acidobacteriota bacterium]